MVPQRTDGSNHGSYCADKGKGQRNCLEEWRSGFVHHFIAKTDDLSHDTRAIFELTNLTSKLPPDLDMDVDLRRNDIKHTFEKVFKNSPEQIPQDALRVKRRSAKTSMEELSDSRNVEQARVVPLAIGRC